MTKLERGDGVDFVLADRKRPQGRMIYFSCAAAFIAIVAVMAALALVVAVAVSASGTGLRWSIWPRTNRRSWR